jgi:hypothetical protein
MSLNIAFLKRAERMKFIADRANAIANNAKMIDFI